MSKRNWVVLCAMVLAMAWAGQVHAGTLYAVDYNSDQLLTIDPATGDSSALGGWGSLSAFPSIYAMAYDPIDETMYAVDSANDQLLSIDLATGAGTAIGDAHAMNAGGFGLGEGMLNNTIRAMTYDPVSRTLVGVDPAAGQFFTLDTQTGEAVGIGSPDANFPAIDGLTIDPVNQIAYAYAPSGNEFIAVDLSTGQITSMDHIDIYSGGFYSVHSLAFNPDDGLIYAVDLVNDQLLSIDPNAIDGDISAVGPWGHLSYAYNGYISYIQSLAYTYEFTPAASSGSGDTSAIPLPAAAVLGLGLCTMIGLRRKR